MCLAILRTSGATIPEDAIRQGWISNSDGGGFAYVKNNKVQVSKGFMKLVDFLEAYNKAVKENHSSPFLIHFRIRSQGDTSPDNTHPFVIPTGAMIHNGTIDGTGAHYGKGPSDTKLFVDKFKDSLNYDFLNENKPALNTVLRFNKLVFLFNDSKHLILNESLGKWNQGVWYSNNSYIPYTSTNYRGF